MTRIGLRCAGWIRVALAVVLLAAVVAVIAWNNRPPEEAPSPVADKARKPAPASSPDPRDTARDRPDRERTNRPGDAR